MLRVTPFPLLARIYLHVLSFNVAYQKLTAELKFQEMRSDALSSLASLKSLAKKA